MPAVVAVMDGTTDGPLLKIVQLMLDSSTPFTGSAQDITASDSTLFTVDDTYDPYVSVFAMGSPYAAHGCLRLHVERRMGTIQDRGIGNCLDLTCLTLLLTAYQNQALRSWLKSGKPP